MQVSIKKFDVKMDIKSNGIEVDVADTRGTHLGDLYVTMTSVIWCDGKTSKAKGKKLSWEKFITLMNAQEKQKPVRRGVKKST
jgi:hypothetical protein